MPRLDRLYSRKTILSAMVAAWVLTATAAAAERGFEFTPLIGYHDGGQFRDGVTGTTVKLNNSGSLALAFNWRAAEPGAQYELFYSRQSTETDATTPIKMKTEYLTIGGTTIVGEPTTRVVPYAVGGIGAARFSPGLSSLTDETRWTLNLGGGVRIPVAAHVRLRFEARGYLTWLGGNSSLFCDAGCQLVAKGRTFFQYEALGGVTVSF